MRNCEFARLNIFGTMCRISLCCICEFVRVYDELSFQLTNEKKNIVFISIDSGNSNLLFVCIEAFILIRGLNKAFSSLCTNFSFCTKVTAKLTNNRLLLLRVHGLYTFLCVCVYRFFSPHYNTYAYFTMTDTNLYISNPLLCT